MQPTLYESPRTESPDAMRSSDMNDELMWFNSYNRGQKDEHNNPNRLS